jgi:hypothetical protein
LATEKSLAEQKQKRAKVLTTMPFSASNVIACDVQVEALEDGLKRLNKLKELLF